MTDPPTVQVQTDGLTLGGTVSAELAPAWRDAVVAAGQATPGPRLVLGELDLDDGVAVAEAVNAVRALRAAWGAIVLEEAPQMLAHTLYKVGALSAGLTLDRPRSDEGTQAP